MPAAGAPIDGPPAQGSPPATPSPAGTALEAGPGLILPVWLAAAARAALQALRQDPFSPMQPLELLQPAGVRPVPVQAAALLADGWALGEALCDPGPGLDLTRGLLVWVLARWLPGEDGGERLRIEAGEGVGVRADSGEACLSTYARELLRENLLPLLPPGRSLQLRLLLPDGRRLALRTSNAAFGVVDGLALIGTQAEVQAGASPDQLQRSLAALRHHTSSPNFRGSLVLVIGENGLDLAPRLGLPAELLLKAGNWIGPLLVAAAEQGVSQLLLFGYQGKLLKLAGGIFHTHHHLADGRAEVLTALAALEGLQGEALEALHRQPTVEAALTDLEQRQPALAERLRQRLAAAIEQRSLAYVQRHGEAAPLRIGAVLFDRARRVRAAGPVGGPLFRQLGGAP